MKEAKWTPFGHPDVLLVDTGANEGCNQNLDINEPSLVILFGWMDASMPLLQKYVQGHQELYPHAILVLVRTNFGFLWSTSSEREERLELLAMMIIEKVYYNIQTRGILLHVISNGGGLQLLALTSILQRLIDLQPIASSLTLPPPIAMIIDSAPGSSDYQTMLSLFTKTTQSPILKEVVKLPASIVWLAYSFASVLRGNCMVLQKLRAQLRSDAPFPMASRETPTAYIYSDKDEIVPFKSIESHLDDLARLGSTGVRGEKYFGSKHVCHAKLDRERYWNTISKVWDDAKRMREGKATSTMTSKCAHNYFKL